MRHGSPLSPPVASSPVHQTRGAGTRGGANIPVPLALHLDMRRRQSPPRRWDPRWCQHPQYRPTHRCQPYCLFNLSSDIGERNDLGPNPAFKPIAQKIAARLRYHASTGPMPARARPPVPPYGASIHSSS